MNQTLPQVTHEHHERILQHVDRMPGIADRLLGPDAGAARHEIDELSAFLAGTLIPHVDAAERTVYPELERMFQNRHSMTPMKREHAEVRRLVAALGTLAAQADAGRPSLGRALAFRRVTFMLYGLLKIHLAEEEAYLRIVEHGVTPDVADMLAAAMAHPAVREP